MLSSKDYIKQSLELNLFFSRIMKEHSFFLTLGLLSRDKLLINQAKVLKDHFTNLLFNTVHLSNGIISKEDIETGDIVTDYTLNAELVTEYYTGIILNTDITYAEKNLISNQYNINVPLLEQRVYALNQNAIVITNNIIKFKSYLIDNINFCNMFTFYYPLMIEHLLDEAKLYLKLLKELQKKQNIYLISSPLNQEATWNGIMGEHAKFIRGMLDPSEKKLIETANDFSIVFDKLVDKAKEAIATPKPEVTVTNESFKATTELRGFKIAGVEGLLNCKIRSIILPLLADHVLREANYYLKLLNIFKQI